MGSTEHLDCSTLLRYFDELNESTNRVSTADFRNHLLRWGMPKDTVKSYMAQFDPKKTGYITRRDLCNALNYYPNRRSFLKDVHIIESDAPQHQRESIISIILGEMKHDGQPKEKLYRAKKRIEKLYGKEWNIFQAYGGYWGLCQYRVSTNLWFNHKGITYGAFQVPDSTDTIKSSRH
ncbi:hypothetical protein ECG_04440 [Echinococcus granulosus]|nr:hypothetical protein ECG_04440 [Echinococcus granulosus]